jgi:acylphosphatase
MAETGARIIVQGRVQNVGFRDFTLGAAGALHLTGTVRNVSDGTVLVHVEGDRNLIEKLIVRLEAGPPSARVIAVLVDWMPANGQYTRFTVEY